MQRERLIREFARIESMLKDFVRGALQDLHAADDVMQEVWVKVLTHPDPPERREEFAPWARGVARNLVLQHWRRSRREQGRPIEAYLDVLEEAFSDADSEIDAWRRRRLVLEECLQTLPERSREILKRRYVDGARSDEMAREQKRSVPALRMMLMRIRQRLADCVQEKWTELESS
jgi:RNA polymerase sigma-70 factor